MNQTHNDLGQDFKHDIDPVTGDCYCFDSSLWPEALTPQPATAMTNTLRSEIFKMLCKLTGADDEDHEESEFETQTTDAIMRLIAIATHAPVVDEEKVRLEAQLETLQDQKHRKFVNEALRQNYLDAAIEVTKQQLTNEQEKNKGERG